MEVPRRLYTTETGEICEEGDPRARFLLSAKGGVITEAEAHRIGLVDYLSHRSHKDEPPETAAQEDQDQAPEVKMVEQVEVEDKAVSGPHEVKEVAEEPSTESETDVPAEGGASAPTESRRSSTRRQGL